MLLGAAAESIEAEDADATELHALLNSICVECAFIISAGGQSAAA